MTGVALTRAQSGIWFAQQRDPSGTAFHCAEYVRIDGPMRRADVERLRRALRRAATETGTLTARIVDGGDGPRQVLGGAFDDPIRVVDVGDEPDPEAAAVAAMRAEVSTPLDLSEGRLFTAVVYLLGEADGVLVYLRAHHVVLDGYGFATVIRRVAALYTADEAGAEPPNCPFTPMDAVLADEADYRGSRRFEADRAFWLGRMAERGDAVSLTAHPRPAVRAPLHHRGTLSGPVARGLDDAARAQGAAWPELAIAAAAAYVHRLTGSAGVTLGLPVLARSGPAARSATTTVNVLPIPLDIDPDGDVASVIRLVRGELAASRKHQRYRHEDLRRDLGMVGGSRRMFGPQVNIKPFGYPLRFGGRAAAVHYLEAGPVDDIELTVHTAAPGGALGFDLAANPDVYSADELAAHHSRLAELVGRLADDASGDRPLRRLDTASAAELRLIARSNSTDHDVADDTLIDRFESAARRTPDSPALRFRGVQWTYRGLDGRAERIAALLRTAHGVSGGIVGVALPRSPELVASLLAVLKCGAAYLPLDPGNPDARIAYMFADAAPACTITDTATADRLPQDEDGARVVLDAPAVRDALESPDAVAPTLRTAPRPTRPAPDDPAYVIYTSGSTGAPKGVVVAHRAIINRLAWMQDAFSLGPADRVLQKTPCGFDVSVWEFFWPLLTGAVLVVAEPDGHRDPAYLAEVIAAEAITTVHFVPSMLEVLTGEPAADRPNALLRVICSGEPLGADLADRADALLGAPVFNLYGPTEAAVDVSWWRHDPGAPRGHGPAGAAVPIGHPVWNTRLHVLDADLRPVPPGSTGELYIAGAQLADGYLGRDELTAQRFLTDVPEAPERRMYRTGDLARRRPDGAIEYTGRIDDQVKIRGVRVEPGEVAAAMEAVDGVRRAAVVATAPGADPAANPGADPAAGTSLIGYAVFAGDESGAAADPASVRRELAATLPAAMVPARVIAVPRMPVTANGKLDHAALPAASTPPPPSALPAADPRSSTEDRVPHTPTEQAICDAVADELDLESVGPDDDFFELGGHSLAAATLVRRLHGLLGRPVGLGTVFTDPTPRALARAADGDDRSLDVLLPLRAGSSAPPLYCVHPAGGIGWGYAGLARVLPDDRPITAIQARGLGRDETAGIPGSIAAMADDYVDRITADGDEGPYHLLGWSVGGVIAHAMAVQLQRRGRTVGSLTMLDAYPADQWRHLAAPTEAEALTALLHMAGHDPRELDEAHRDRRGVLELLRRSGSALGSLDGRTLSAVVDVVAANARLMRTHEHGVFDGDLLLFTAAAPRAEDWLDHHAWRPYIAGRLEAHDIDCTHPEMIGRAAFERIGPLLADRLAG